MGLDASDTRPIKRANLSGAELLLLSEQQLVTLLDVPLHKARRLMRLQVGGYVLIQHVYCCAGSCCCLHARSTESCCAR